MGCMCGDLGCPSCGAQGADPEAGARLDRWLTDPTLTALAAEAGEEVSMSEGARRIAAERQRQIEAEGWTPEHDDEHGAGQLAAAAACYAHPLKIERVRFWSSHHGDDDTEHGDGWPWAAEWDKRLPRPLADGDGEDWTARIRELEKAGALIAAEIDRLLRALERDAARAAGRE